MKAMSRLMLFAKRPRTGRVKTRLCPPLTAEQALVLYRGFLVDGLDLLRRCSNHHRTELWWDGPPDAAALEGLDLDGIETRTQSDGDLGHRLAAAFGAESSPAIVIGADSPTLGRADIDRAFATLSELRPVVLKPSLDGGFLLLGLWQPHEGLFREIPWGGGDVSEVTLQRARELRLRVEIQNPGYDVDDAEGLRRLEADLADPAIAARAPATLRALRLLF